jgi:hypothetical protein
MNRQTFPDSQKEPLGPNQIAWIDRHYGKAFFRDAKPMVECNCHQSEHPQKPGS